MGLGVFTALLTTGAAGFFGGALPQQHHRSSGGTEAAVHRGDAFEVTVRSVSDVDSFEGMEPATGLPFRARVAGIRRMADCRQAESRTAAQNLLRGKTVWLTVRKEGTTGADEIPVDVRLPDGADYAQTVVHDGVALADISSRGELASVEAAAREERRGMWVAGCVGDAVTAPSSSAPSSSSSSAPATSTTTATSTPRPESSEPAPPEPTETTTSSAAPPGGDDEWMNARLGKPCLIEGTRRTSPNGNELVCARNAKGQLRWRRAD
jgi:endonuclease YncB( thermonuclease family)